MRPCWQTKTAPRAHIYNCYDLSHLYLVFCISSSFIHRSLPFCYCAILPTVHTSSVRFATNQLEIFELGVTDLIYTHLQVTKVTKVAKVERHEYVFVKRFMCKFFKKLFVDDFLLCERYLCLRMREV